MLRAQLAPDGTVLEVVPAATAGGEAFGEEARRGRWRGVRSEESAEGCEMPQVIFACITYTIQR